MLGMYQHLLQDDAWVEQIDAKFLRARGADWEGS